MRASRLKYKEAPHFHTIAVSRDRGQGVHPLKVLCKYGSLLLGVGAS